MLLGNSLTHDRVEYKCEPDRQCSTLLRTPASDGAFVDGELTLCVAAMGIGVIVEQKLNGRSPTAVEENINGIHSKPDLTPADAGSG